MDTRLYFTSRPSASEQIEELSTVELVDAIEMTPVGYLPKGSKGTVVFVHDGGVAYEVEFALPFHALITLDANQIRALSEATRERVIAAADGLLHRHSKN